MSHFKLPATPGSERPLPSSATAPLYYGGHPAGSSYYGAPPPGAGGSGSLDPLRLLQIAQKKWLTILLAATFACGAAFFYLSKAVRRYQAQATIELSVRRPRILNQQEAVIEDPSSISQAEATLNTQVEKLRSPNLLPYVVACYREKFPHEKQTDEELALRLGKGVEFTLIRRTRLVQVTFRSSDPEFAVKACDAFAAGAEARARAENRELSDGAVTWLEAQAQSQKTELEMADKALFDARQEHQMDVLEGQRKTVENALLSFNESLTQIENKAALEQKLLDSLNAGHLPAEVPQAVGIENSLDRLRAAVAERKALLTRYTPEHPAVQAQDKAVAVYREQAMSALKRAKSTAAANLALYGEQVKSLRLKKEQQLQLASALERDILNGEMKIAALERSRGAADSSYRGVLSRIQEARLSADENTATVKQIQAASAPIQIKPRPLQVWILALILGLVGGLGIAVLSETVEDHVVGANDIEAGMGVKILAVIPHVRTRERKKIATASLTHCFKDMAEAFAGLRSVLDSAVYRDQAQMILVASSLPEEGKTTTCCNLASACALNGQKTLLIDFDLRRPRVAGIFPMPEGHRGLLEYLASEAAQPREIVYASECKNLSVIASRSSAEARPAELVGGTKVADLLIWARANFERIIIDAPPLGIVSDALALAGLANCVLVMARPATSRKRAVRHTIQRFQDVGVANLAVVMNDVGHSKVAYRGYGPYYHYRKQSDAYLGNNAKAKP